MRSHPLALAALFVLFASSAAPGCGSEDDPADPTSSGTGASGASSSGSGGTGGTGAAGSGGTGNTGGEPPECDVPTVRGSGPELVLDTVSATVVDLAGDPVANAEVQLCGINLCLYGETDATGQAIVVNGGGDPLDRPAFKYGEGFRFARFALPLDADSEDLGELVTVPLPDSGAEMAAGAEATSGPVTLTIAHGAAVEVDELIYDEPDEQTFRAAQMPVAQIAAGIAVPAGIELVYGVGPLETHFCPAAQVTVQNDAGWAAGADVEFWAHGVDIFEYTAPYGGWAKISDGKVSADGATISTAADQGMLVLTTFGVKLK
jgi:hypothetical protein